MNWLRGTYLLSKSPSPANLLKLSHEANVVRGEGARTEKFRNVDSRRIKIESLNAARSKRNLLLRPRHPRPAPGKDSPQARAAACRGRSTARPAHKGWHASRARR